MTGPLPSTAQPVVWVFLGYPFEAASMIAGLGACVTVRVWISLKDNAASSARARMLDIAVSTIALLFSAGWIALQRPSPFYALLSGSGFGALGSGIIALSLRWIERLNPAPPSTPTDGHSDDSSQIEAVRTRARDAQHHTPRRP